MNVTTQSLIPPHPAGSDFELRAQLRAIYGGGDVQRFHTMRTVKPNTVGQHSYGVALLCQLLAPNCSKKLLLAALTHDMAEQWTGDVPAPAKIAMGISQSLHELEETTLLAIGIDYGCDLNQDERRILKLADTLDGLMFCILEFNLGNASIYTALKNFKDYAKKNLVTEHEIKLFRLICDEVQSYER